MGGKRLKRNFIKEVDLGGLARIIMALYTGLHTVSRASTVHEARFTRYFAIGPGATLITTNVNTQI